MGELSTSPAQYAAEITPSDAAALSRPTRGLYVGSAGDLVVTFVGGTKVTLTNVPVGLYPFAVKNVWSTGTVASGIVGLW